MLKINNIVDPALLPGLIRYFEGFLTDQRKDLIEQNLSNRTRYITVVLEDLFQPQNASAVLRTCDCFGIQDVHVIENRNLFKLNPDVERGATRWLDIHHHQRNNDNTLTTLNELKANGYRIVATSPHAPDAPLESFDLSLGKTALIFGTEREGISSVVRDQADELIKIPMVGFTESFNISVSVAIILHVFTTALRQSNITWQLTDVEREQLKYKWLKNSLRKPELIEKLFLDQNKVSG
jgi:tRNA (guanosine-2'-O-)-methyltransferase